MTATTVNGLEVLADEPTEAPMRANGTGKHLVWHQTRTLLLEDGTTTYGCVHCDYTNANVHSIRPHLNKHRETLPRSAASKDADLTLRHLTRVTNELIDAKADRDKWKARALRAERDLNTIRTALTGGNK